MDNRKMIYLDDAIDALERKKDKKAKGDIGGFYNKIIQNDIDALMQLSSAQPERKTGKWVNCYTDGFRNMCKCSECGARIDIQEKFRSFFCYHCGADMRDESDETN